MSESIDDLEDLNLTKIAKRNGDILSEIDDTQSGTVKNASEASTKMLRREIKEQGFLRRIIPPVTVTNEDLDRVLDHERPVIIRELEPKSRGAITLPFGASTDTEAYYGNKYEVIFETISTLEYTKDINELRTYRGDLRKFITDSCLREIETREDATFIALFDSIVGPSNGVGLSGVQQHFLMPGGITRENYVNITSVLEDQKLNNGVILMNRKTAKEFLKWDRNEIGGDLAESLFKEGMTALQSATIMGIKHIFTIKRDLVPAGGAWTRLRSPLPTHKPGCLRPRHRSRSRHSNTRSIPL